MSRHILILVENLSVPFDRRVWQEARALTAAGFTVTVICPVGAGQDRERETTIDGIRILRYPLRAATGGPLGYLFEYTQALFHTLRLAIRVRRHERVDVVQACNPPDLLFLVALALAYPASWRYRLRSLALALMLFLPLSFVLLYAKFLYQMHLDTTVFGHYQLPAFWAGFMRNLSLSLAEARFIFILLLWGAVMVRREDLRQVI